MIVTGLAHHFAPTPHPHHARTQQAWLAHSIGSSPQSIIVTFFEGFPEFEPTSSIFFTTSYPSKTSPKTTCFPLRWPARQPTRQPTGRTSQSKYNERQRAGTDWQRSR
eukprot:3202106-Rhodomonas_salina.4